MRLGCLVYSCEGNVENEVRRREESVDVLKESIEVFYFVNHTQQLNS